MPRRTYDPAHGRPRPQQQRGDWKWLRELLASSRTPGPAATTQDPRRDQRRPAQENRA